MDIDIIAPTGSTSEQNANSSIINSTAQEIKTICDEIKQIAENLQTPNQQTTAVPEINQKLLYKVTNTFVRLRLLNRKLHEGKAALVQSASEMKQKTDTLALDLENKKREVAYIENEIESTEKLETIYQNIDLIPLDEFMESAPEEFKEGMDSPHEVMVRRLRYEIKQRDLLIEAKREAKNKRDELRKAKRRRIERLEKIDSHLQTYIKSLALLGRSIGVEQSGRSENTDDSNNVSTERSKSRQEAAEEDAEEPIKESKRAREIRGERPSSRITTPMI